MKRSIALVAVAALLASCGSGSTPAPAPSPSAPSNTQLVAQGRQIFRYNTFGDEQFWTNTLHMNTVIESAVSPKTALSVGLKVDMDALPASVLAGIQNGTIDLNSPATTVTLLKLNAVVGVIGQVDANNNLTSAGISCALCHSTVDNAFAPGIGHRLDGWQNRDLNPGAIIALSPALTAAQKAVYNSWGPGRYDPRYNLDGINGPVMIPPAYGLNGVQLATYTGDGSIEYWNDYVAITQMHGLGSFSDPRLGINVTNGTQELVKPLLPALAAYEHSLAKPSPPPGINPAAAARGQVVFAANCAVCHSGALFTDDTKLHAQSETGMDPTYANRSATKLYRTTPLRGLAYDAPYFHDGSAATPADVVSHYNGYLHLGLTAQQQSDLVEYLKTL